MDKNTRIHLDCLYTAAWLDGQPGPEECSVLDRIMVRLGIPRDWIMQELGRFSQTRPNQVPRPGQVPEAMRPDVLRDILAVCLADQVLSPEESAYLDALSGSWSLELEPLRKQAEDFVEKRTPKEAPSTPPTERRDPLKLAEEQAREHGRTVFKGEGFGQALDLGGD